VHARGRFGEAAEGGDAAEPVAAIQARCPEVRAGSELYRALADLGLGYGPRFQGVEQAWSGEDEALGLIRSPKGAAHARGRAGGHPALLDACSHVMGLAGGGGELFVPTGVAALRLVGDPADVRWSHARVTGRDDEGFTAAFVLLDEAGRPVV